MKKFGCWGKWARPNFKCIRPIRFRFCYLLLLPPTNMSHNSLSSLLLLSSPSFFSFFLLFYFLSSLLLLLCEIFATRALPPATCKTVAMSHHKNSDSSSPCYGGWPENSYWFPPYHAMADIKQHWLHDALVHLYSFNTHITFMTYHKLLEIRKKIILY